MRRAPARRLAHRQPRPARSEPGRRTALTRRAGQGSAAVRDDGLRGTAAGARDTRPLMPHRSPTSSTARLIPGGQRPVPAAGGGAQPGRAQGARYRRRTCPGPRSPASCPSRRAPSARTSGNIAAKPSSRSVPAAGGARRRSRISRRYPLVGLSPDLGHTVHLPPARGPNTRAGVPGCPGPLAAGWLADSRRLRRRRQRSRGPPSQSCSLSKEHGRRDGQPHRPRP